MFNWRDYLEQRTTKDVGGKPIMNPAMDGENVELTVLRRHENTGEKMDPSIQRVTPKDRENELNRAAQIKKDAQANFDASIAKADKIIENIETLFADAKAVE